MKKIYELISARQAKANGEKAFYVYEAEGRVYAYNSNPRIKKHEERFRSICNAKDWKTKLEDDMKEGWKPIIINE